MENNLYYKKTNVYEKLGMGAVNEINSYSEGYKTYLDASKTERDCVKTSIELAKAHGYVEYNFGMKIERGGKYYYNNHNRSLYLFKIGSEDINNGMRIVASHIDSPRIDFKQMPIYEDGGFCFAKTRYYGGIRKYQWLATPLALHGTIVKKNGESIEINIGDGENDPVFYITDLLPHLSQEYNSKPLSEAVSAEKLNILLGSIPSDCEDANEKIKHNILTLLNEKYGIVEEDFLSGDIFALPAGKARDVGFDRSLILAYGHDDKVCAYPSLTALFEAENSEHTILVVLADKEEIGSEGNTGMKSEIFPDIMNIISESLGGNIYAVRANSKCLSADVSSCYDPNYSEAFDPKNVNRINCGVAMSKYTGSRGKSGTNDACAEYIAYIRRLFEENKVVWQAGDMGKNDLGGGGTVAKIVANLNIETVDLGVPVLSMHAPYEVISKADIYCAHKALLAFCK